MKKGNMKKWMVASALGLGSLVFLGGCLHAFIDADEKEKETGTLSLFATAATMPTINGGGRAGVDAFCTNHKPSSLKCTGGLHAFINVSVSDKVDFFTTAYPSLPQDLPVYNADKTKKIADNWQDLMDGSIDMSLADAGIIPSGGSNQYWTGGDGTYCTNWAPTTPATDHGGTGDVTVTDATWFTNGQSTCTASYPVLCLCWD